MVIPISEKKQPTCLQACCDRGQPGIAGGSFHRPWSWHQECNGTMLAWYDTGPKGMQRYRGLDQSGSTVALKVQERTFPPVIAQALDLGDPGQEQTVFS